MSGPGHYFRHWLARDAYEDCALTGNVRPASTLACVSGFHAAAHILILTLLAGCDHMPRTVEIPVPVACVKPEQIPARPPLILDSQFQKSERGARTRGLLLYQAEAEPYIRDLEAIAQNCARIK